ncbi:MAG: hypothetical protein DPW21_00095 [Anaerolineae bacterium]|nr:hypothetical protein [Chloroflexi bacterium CFX2]MCQ3945081.1 hypothetical protein [Anaerolineae bacterium]MCZ7550854.1 hypothetical protein [Anaerolineales bacterium]GER79238.1 conserved hypothetical protein [Candidatus Denitrolinea symbiosum]HPP64450.1 hypothetical protein [Anaerolineales bacterium]
MKRFLIPSLLILTLILAACSATRSPLLSDPVPASASSSDSASQFDSAMRTDGQGAIIFEVTPLNLDAPAGTLEFDIVLTTHSIELSMDLAATATLTTETGVTVQATLWDAPRGGHHVEGKLIFPASVDGKSILEGATKLTITILNVDAPSRVFEWGAQ